MSERSAEMIADPPIPDNAISMTEWEKHDRVEVVNGEIVEMSPPALKHVILTRFIYNALFEFLKENPLGELWFDNTPYILDGDERDDWVRGSRIPDVSFVSKERFSAHVDQYGNDAKYFHLAPDLAVEIVSEHDRYSDIFQKITDYLKYGTQLVWIIDAPNRTIRVHTPDKPDGQTLKDTDILTGDPVLQGWSMSVAAIIDTSLSPNP
jgi:Uma2 family endonuclease